MNTVCQDGTIFVDSNSTEPSFQAQDHHFLGGLHCKCGASMGCPPSTLAKGGYMLFSIRITTAGEGALPSVYTSIEMYGPTDS